MRRPSSLATALLGMSAPQRVAWALGLAAAVWVCVWWAL
jgi:hypothetical protein